MALNTKQAKTLGKIYARPTRSNVIWKDIVSLLKACGAEIYQRHGSRVCVKLGDQRAVLHAPHPQKEAVKGAVEDIRAFLRRAGIAP